MEKIQEILNNGLEEYEKENKIVMYNKKVINAIKNCKTANIGAHKYICDECGYEEMPIIHVGIGIVRTAKQERN